MLSIPDFITGGLVSAVTCSVSVVWSIPVPDTSENEEVLIQRVKESPKLAI